MQAIRSWGELLNQNDKSDTWSLRPAIFTTFSKAKDTKTLVGF